MIIKYYQGYVPHDILLELTKTSKTGTNAYYLLEAAKEIGMETKGVSCQLEQTEDIILPCIASVTIDSSYEHYVVIYEINKTKKTLLIADPSSELKKISFEDFNKIYNNVLLFLYPIHNLPRYPKPKNFLFFIVDVIKPHKKLVLQLIGISILTTGLSIIGTFYLKELVNVITTAEKNNFIFILLLFSIIFILKIFYQMIRNLLLLLLHHKLDTVMTCDVFKMILNLPYPYYRNKTTGELVARINDLNQVKDMIGNVITTIFIDGFVTLVAATFLYQIHPFLFFLVIFLITLFFLLTLIFRPLFRRSISRLQEEEGIVNSTMIEQIQGFETVKGLHLEETFFQKFEQNYLTYLKHIFKFKKRCNIQVTLKDFLDQIGYFIILGVAAFLTIENKISFNSFLSFQALFFYVLDPIKNILDLDLPYHQAKSALSRVLELQSKDLKKPILTLQTVHKIELKNLAYPKEDPILKNINLNFSRGEKIVILGPSGIGKSTLLKIIKGYYQTQPGTFNINDIDSCHYDINSLNNKISYLSQDEILFTDTIYHNLILNRQIKQEDLIKVVELCEIDEILKEHPLGYHYLLEENGFNISGGQKDRIILARTLLNQSDVYLIDEGLSQVDHNMERRILKNVFNNYSDKIFIMVSHRQNNIDLFDQVITLNETSLTVLKKGESYEDRTVSN